MPIYCLIHCSLRSMSLLLILSLFRAKFLVSGVLSCSRTHTSVFSSCATRLRNPVAIHATFPSIPGAVVKCTFVGRKFLLIFRCAPEQVFNGWSADGSLTARSVSLQLCRNIHRPAAECRPSPTPAGPGQCGTLGIRDLMEKPLHDGWVKGDLKLETSYCVLSCDRAIGSINPCPVSTPHAVELPPPLRSPARL